MTHDQEREKFEKWFVKHISGAPMLEKENNGEYSHMPTRIRWQAWQAAKREPVGEGEVVDSCWSGWAVQYEGRLPKLFGAKEIAELNFNPDENCRLIFLQEVDGKAKQPAKPVYQVHGADMYWRDVSKETYDSSLMKNCRRTLYEILSDAPKTKTAEKYCPKVGDRVLVSNSIFGGEPTGKVISKNGSCVMVRLLLNEAEIEVLPSDLVKDNYLWDALSGKKDSYL